MCERRCRETVMLVVIVTALWLPCILRAEETLAGGPDKLTFSVQPYVWLPVLEADLNFSTPSGSSGAPSVKVEPDDYLEDLSAAVILTTEARKGKWSFTADFIYMELESSENNVKSVDFQRLQTSIPIDTGSDVDMKNFISTFGGGYQVIDNHRLKMDVVAGFRYLWIEARLNWRLASDVTDPDSGQTFERSGSHKEDDDIWNAIGGFTGRFLLGETNFFIPFHVDVGAGDSDLTWQVFSALGYTFNDRIDAMLGFRHMEFEKDGNELIEDLSLSGPVLGMRFSF